MQPIVTLSSTEAEYVALCSAVQEAVYLRRLFSSIGMKQKAPTVIYEDNQSTIALSQREVTKTNDHTKHIDVRFHFTKDKIREQVIKLEYVPTKHQLADALTKDLKKTAFKYQSNRLLNTLVSVPDLIVPQAEEEPLRVSRCQHQLVLIQVATQIGGTNRG